MEDCSSGCALHTFSATFIAWWDGGKKMLLDLRKPAVSPNARLAAVLCFVSRRYVDNVKCLSRRPASTGLSTFFTAQALVHMPIRVMIIAYNLWPYSLTNLGWERLTQ